MVSGQFQKITVVGLGYVGLPLACLLSTKYQVIGFDIDEERINKLKQGIDDSGEVEDLNRFNIEYTSNPALIKKTNFIILAVPTPVNENNEPDLSLLKKASKIVGQNLNKGSIVVYESTVFPGCTEEVCLPILEKESGLKAGRAFKIGYSPERVNPGDKEHTIDKIIKVVSGQDEESRDIIYQIYNSVIPRVYKTSSIKIAEAAKVIENIQRDLNIALINELALIFEKMGINTREVLEAAGTKWNFHKYYPGLVGGHCIPVDPYYLTYKAKRLGYNPKVILAGRAINNLMSESVAKKALDFLKDIGSPKVLIMGLTFKENVPDIRNSKVKDIIKILKENNINIKIIDPLLSEETVKNDFQVEPIQWPTKEKFDLILVVSPHKEFKSISLNDLHNIMTESKILMDLKEFYNKEEAGKLDINYWSL